MNNHYVFYVWRINIEETMKRLTGVLPFFHGNHGNNNMPDRASCSSSDDRNTMATGGTPAAAPFIIKFSYKNFKQDAGKRSTDCQVCDIRIKDAGATTSNFIRHLKTHLERSVTLTNMDG